MSRCSRRRKVAAILVMLTLLPACVSRETAQAPKPAPRPETPPVESEPVIPDVPAGHAWPEAFVDATCVVQVIAVTDGRGLRMIEREEELLLLDAFNETVFGHPKNPFRKADPAALEKAAHAREEAAGTPYREAMQRIATASQSDYVVGIRVSKLEVTVPQFGQKWAKILATTAAQLTNNPQKPARTPVDVTATVSHERATLSSDAAQNRRQHVQTMGALAAKQLLSSLARVSASGAVTRQDLTIVFAGFEEAHKIELRDLTRLCDKDARVKELSTGAGDLTFVVGTTKALGSIGEELRHALLENDIRSELTLNEDTRTLVMRRLRR